MADFPIREATEEARRRWATAPSRSSSATATQPSCHAAQTCWCGKPEVSARALAAIARAWAPRRSLRRAARKLWASMLSQARSGSERAANIDAAVENPRSASFRRPLTAASSARR